MIFNKHLARGLLVAMVLLLLVGTLMPGVWRNALEASLQAPFPLAKLAHLLIFMAMAFVVRVSNLSWSVPMVLLAALGLGVLTEGLQLVAIGRNANWRDVGIDVLGAGLGLVFALISPKSRSSSPLRVRVPCRRSTPRSLICIGKLAKPSAKR